jgi:hypothetical protein
VRLLAIERVEQPAELELQAALGAKLPASVLLFQTLSDELTRFQADQEPTAENYPLLASLVGKRGAVDLQRAAQLGAERRTRWLQRAAAVEAVRLRTLEDLEGPQRQEEIDAVLQRMSLTPNLTLPELAGSSTAERLGINNTPSKQVVERLPLQEELRVDGCRFRPAPCRS